MGINTILKMNDWFREAIRELKRKEIIERNEDIVKATGFTKSAISNYINGNMKASKNFITKFTGVYKIHLSRPYFEDSDNNKFVQDVVSVPASDFMEVPVLRIEAQAGYFKGHADIEIEKEMDTMLIPTEYDKGHYLVVEVQGDSMNDGTFKTLGEKDKVLVKELPKEFWKTKLHIKKHVWVIVHKDGVVFKEIKKHDVEKGIITLHSWNNYYKDYDVNLRDVYKLFYLKKLVERVISF